MGSDCATWARPAQIRRVLIMSGITEQPTVSIHYSRLVAREIGAREKEVSLLLRGTGITPTAFMRDETVLTTQQQTIIALNALALSGDEGLGLRVGRLLRPETYGPMGFLVSASPNLRMAVEHFQTFLPTRIPFADLSTGFDGQMFVCHLGVRYTDSEDMYRAAIESISLSLLSIVESIVGASVTTSALRCRYPTPSYAARYQKYFPIPVEFNASESCLLIPKALLATPNPIASKANYALAVRQCRAMLDTLSIRQPSTKNRVKEVLLSAPPGTVGESSVAESLFISRRTLVRRLAQENTSFKLVREELLASIAAMHLQETRDSVESIAALLNYHDSSNFRRAFKKWFNKTPDEYRRSHTKVS
jgi:AraC-like DNA-binding protein